MSVSHILRIEPKQVSFLCCDMQEIFLNRIYCSEHIKNTVCALIQTAAVFNIPVVISEQYPDRLGKTVECIETGRAEVFAKTSFTMVTEGFP